MRNFFKDSRQKFSNNVFNVIRQRGLGKTLLIWFLVLSLLPLIFSSIVSYFSASKILQQETLQSLNSISRLKAQYINSYFAERIEDLKFLSQLSSTAGGMEDMILNWKETGKSLKDYVDSMDYDTESIGISADMETFQLAVTDTFNIYIVDLEGNVIYTLHDAEVRGRNINGDKSRLSKTWEKALKSQEPLFSDIQFIDEEGSKEAACFLVQQMRDDDDKPVGVMAVEVPLKKINQIMQANTEGRETGETFLVGSDFLMRSDSLFEKQSDDEKAEGGNAEEKKAPGRKSTVMSLQHKRDTRGTRQWKKRLAKDYKPDQEQSHSDVIYLNHANQRVVGVSYDVESLKVLGVNWGVIAEISEAEAFASARKLGWTAVIFVLVTILIVFIISLAVARKIGKPIRALSGWAQRVAIGDLRYEQITQEKNEIGEMNSSFKAVVDSFQAVTDVCETIAVGDFTKTVAIRSEMDALGRAVNQMKENLVEVVRQADNISMGDYSAEVVPKSEKDMLGIALGRMTSTLRDAAKVAEEVSIGDYSLKMDIRGEKDMLGTALNQMIERLKESNADSQRKIDYLNNIPTPVHVIDNDYNVKFINKAGASIVGRTVDESIGKKCYALFNTSHCRTEKCRAYRAMNQDKVLTGDTVSMLPDRDIPMRYTSAPLKDGDGKIIGAIEYMVDINDEMRVVELAEMISRGDYSVKIEKRSDEDRLSDALNRMTMSLREAVEQNQQQNWLKSGQSELNNRMRGELDIPELSSNIVSFLTTYLDAQLGLLYFVAKAKTLKLVGSYALGKERGAPRQFKFGEGIVGQAALESTLITITDITEDHIKVKTGFGELHPRNVIAVPFSYEGSVIGVIELASIHKFQDIQKEFLMQSLENIAIALNSAESRRQLTELLEKTQEQAEKLQAQQEELRQSNEELEGQTKALIASETNLQSQQEELRVINEELEERTRALEKQKTDVQQKNKELMVARNEIAKKAMDLEEVSKYKSEFLANMSHELRTPLNSILILSQLLSNNSDTNLSEKQVEFSKTIHSSGSDLLALINEILDLSKIEAGMMEIRIEKIAIDDFAGNIKRVFKPVAANKGIDFIMDVDNKSLPEFIYTDTQRAQQIIKNLLSNAFKFTDEGNVTFAAYRPDKDTDLSYSGLNPVDAVALAVRDTGIGIPKEKQTIIFEAFRQEDGTTSRKYGGTGLGLSISRELALLLGGEIQMNSEKGKGSSFILYLPQKLIQANKRGPLGRLRSQTESSTPPELKLPPHSRKPKKAVLPSGKPGKSAETPFIKPEIGTGTGADADADLIKPHEVTDDRKEVKPGDKSLLIIEDDSAFSEILLNLARNRGFKTIIAEDGETGLHFADFYKPSAIILDIGLPGINGWEVMERLKKNTDTRHIPVHFMSASDNNLEALNMGAIGYLSKPVNTSSIDNAFGKIEHIISKPVKKLLVADNDEKEKENIQQLIGSGDVSTVTVNSGKEALKHLRDGDFDTMILSPNLSDMQGIELLGKIKDDTEIKSVPIIMYSEKELGKKYHEMIKKYAKSITIKDVHSPDRLFVDSTLFLHRVESNLPQSKQHLMERMVNKKDMLSGKKILVVDDDMRNVFALTSILEENGMDTVVGKNGKEGVEKIKADDRIDLVLMDIMMPVMDGYEAMKAIRKEEKYAKLPIIALTAKAMKGDRSKCVAAGASDYLAKPVDSAKLLSLLRVWMYQANN